MGVNPGLNDTKDTKIVLDASLIHTQLYNIWIKGKWSNARKRVMPSCTVCFQPTIVTKLTFKEITYAVYIYNLP